MQSKTIGITSVSLRYVPMFIALLSFGNCIFSQQVIKKKSLNDTIAFTLTSQNNIAIQATINRNNTVNFMFHTGVNAVSLTPDATTEIFPAETGRDIEIRSWGGKGNSSSIDNNTLKIGKTIRDSLTIWTGMLSGPATDGKFGPNLFEEDYIEIDYEKKLMLIHSSLPEEMRVKDFQVMKLQNDRSLYFMEATLSLQNDTVAHSFMLHTGYGGSILLDDTFVQEHDLEDKLIKIGESQLKDSFGNVILISKCLLPELQIGNFKLFDVPVNFFEGSLGKQSISVIGNELIRRFNFILDKSSNTIFLKPNVFYTAPFEIKN